MRTQIEAFLAKKATRADEAATRAAIKLLGYLELPACAAPLLAFTAPRHPAGVRVEAVTALRFGLRDGPDAKTSAALLSLLTDADAGVARAARDTLTVVPLDARAARNLAKLLSDASDELGLWIVAKLGSLGGAVAAELLAPVAQASNDRARAEAAARALAELPRGEVALAHALAGARSEAGAQMLADALGSRAKDLDGPTRAALLRAGCAELAKHPALARRKLEPVREADPLAWAEVLRAAARAWAKKDPARAEPLFAALARSSVAQPADRFAHARLQLLRSPLDPHPSARQRDPALAELQHLADRGFRLVEALEADAELQERHRYYVAFHFAEARAPELRALGISLLEGVAARAGRTKLGKAARNKLQLA